MDVSPAAPAQCTPRLQNDGVPETAPTHRVAVESTPKRVFATALDWPGWSRAGKSEDFALEALLTSAPRYARLVSGAGVAFARDAPAEVVLRVPGSAYTDFGVPGAEFDFDLNPLPAAEVKRTLALLVAAWEALDAAVAAAPAELRKGPRGGGRDRDKVAAHVLEAEAAYAGPIGFKLVPPAIEDEVGIATHRAAVLEALTAVASRPAPIPGAKPKRWTFRYATRRIAWHALDHAWEIEDRSSPEPV